MRLELDKDQRRDSKLDGVLLVDSCTKMNGRW